MGLSDTVHALWVLLTVLSFTILVWEGIKRRSLFYTALFGAMGVLSFLMHLEEVGFVHDIPEVWHDRLQFVDLGLSWFMAAAMMLVVLEIKMIVTGRIAGGILALILTLRNVRDTKFNAAATILLGAVLLVVDARVNRRRFSQAWWQRLALIIGMAAGGALLFRGLKGLWSVHGLWHVYYVISCWLILAAERHKKATLAAKARLAAASSGGSRALTSGAGATAKRRNSFDGAANGASGIV